MIIDSYKGRPGAILSQKTLKEMWTSRTTKISGNITHFSTGTKYGYGWVITDLDPKLNPNIKHPHFVWHDGGLSGLSTHVNTFFYSIIITHYTNIILAYDFSRRRGCWRGTGQQRQSPKIASNDIAYYGEYLRLCFKLIVEILSLITNKTKLHFY